MRPDPTPEEREEALRALGSFVMSFSGLMHALERRCVRRIAAHSKDNHTEYMETLLHAALGERMAKPVCDGFFAVLCAEWKELFSEEDQTIVGTMRREIEALISTRNRLMHDAWMYSSIPGDRDSKVLALHRKRQYGGGITHEVREVTIAELVELGSTASRLAYAVAATDRVSLTEAGPDFGRHLNVVDGKVSAKSLAGLSMF